MSTEPITKTHKPLAPDGRPETWVFLRDCPMPPGAQRDFERECQAYPWPLEQRLWLQDDLKLCYLFSDQWVATKRTDRSLIVLMVGDDMRAFRQFRESLSQEELSQVLILFNRDPNVPPETVI